MIWGVVLIFVLFSLAFFIVCNVHVGTFIMAIGWMHVESYTEGKKSSWIGCRRKEGMYGVHTEYGASTSYSTE